MTDRRKIRELNRHRGIPNRLPATTAQAHLKLLRQTMSWGDIATAVGASACHLRRIASGEEPRINLYTHEKILAAQPAPSPWRFVDATGSRRRIHALQARGHSQADIAAAAHTTQYRIGLISNGQRTVRDHLAERLAAAYDELAHRDGTSTRGRNFARANHWPSPGCWDDDTIDDPTAHPEWTGACGTLRGWWIHRAEHIPMCGPCEQGHAEWTARHQHLDRTERAGAVARAKEAARVGRGVALAEDGHELVRRHGYTVEQAAERLGVPKSRLEVEMRRHEIPVAA